MNQHIEHHFGLQLATKYSSLSDELGKLRLNSLSSASVDANGNLQIVNRPGLAATHARIAALEPRVERIVAIADEVGRILEGVGISDPLSSEQSFQSRLEHLAMDADPSPACWQEFTRLHGMNPGKLPGDLMKDAEYSAYEKARREKSAAARKEMDTLKAAMAAIDPLISEAASL